MKIAVLGPEGTFSDKAYLEYAEVMSTDGVTLEPTYYPTIDEVFSAVCPGECDLGIVPVENTLDGYVQRTLDLLLEKDVHIIDENQVKVQFSLVGNVTNLEEINKLYVQFKSNGQCRQFINSLENIKIVTTESNMESYYNLGSEQGAAAIVPKHIAKKEQDRFVVDNVTDADNNHTRFLVITKGYADDKRVEAVRTTNLDKKVRIPVYIMPATERPGILFEILKSFSEKQINLISIMSRPTKHELGTYNFYIEIDGYHSQLDDIIDTLQNMKEFNNIKILGIYNE